MFQLKGHMFEASGFSGIPSELDGCVSQLKGHMLASSGFFVKRAYLSGMTLAVAVKQVFQVTSGSHAAAATSSGLYVSS